MWFFRLVFSRGHSAHEEPEAVVKRSLSVLQTSPMIRTCSCRDTRMPGILARNSSDRNRQRTRDRAFPPQNGETVQAQIPSPRISNASFLALPGVKHMLRWPDKTCTVCLVPKQGLEQSKRPRSRSCLLREVPEKGFYFCKSLKGTVRKVTV